MDDTTDLEGCAINIFKCLSMSLPVSRGSEKSSSEDLGLATAHRNMYGYLDAVFRTIFSLAAEFYRY